MKLRDTNVSRAFALHAPLSFFEPLVMQLFERPRASVYAKAIAESG